MITRHKIYSRVVIAVVALVVGCFSIAGIMRAFAMTSAMLSFSTSGDVELDGTSGAQVTVNLTAAQSGKLYAAQGAFSTTEIDDSNHYFAIDSLNVGNVINDYSQDNSSTTGQFYYVYSTAANGVEFSVGDYLYEMVYNVSADTPAGTYHLPINIEYVQQTSIDDYEEGVVVDATVTVTRNEVPAEKGMPEVTFRDEEGNPITDTIVKHYGDERFTVKKEVTTGDGAIVEYHPADNGSGTIARTISDSDLVEVGEPGLVQICARVEETDNYVEATFCYQIQVEKRTIGVGNAVVMDKTFDGTTEATVSSVTFSNLGNGVAPAYTAEGTFGTADAGVDKPIRVNVTLTDDALNRYTLNPNYFDMTKTISPFGLVFEDVELTNGSVYEYSPEGVEPAVRVTANVHGGVSTLVAGTDYNVSYSDNMGVGTGHVAITGAGNFTTGENPLILDFTITKKGINNSNLTVPSSLVEGRILTPNDVSVNVDGQNLVRCESAGDTNCDYVLEISGENDGIVGHTVHVAVNACNNYDGVAVADIGIVAKQEQTVTIADVTNTTVSKTYGDADFTYTATSDGDGGISYSSTNEAVATVDDSGKVTVVGVGDADIVATAAETDTYAEGSAKYTVSVAKKVITVTDATVSNKVYDGTPVATVMNVALSESSLTYNTDYTATALFNDVDVAIRSVEVMVALTDDNFANYCFMHESSCAKNASYSATATITPFTLGGDNTTVDLALNPYVYNGSEITPEATVKVDLDGDGIKETTLTFGTDYEMSYENNVNRGTGSATVSGKGNYAGSLTGLDFEIIAAPVENVVVTAPAQDYTGEALEPVPTVTGEINGSSMTFNAGDYYVIPHADFKNAGSYTFSVKSVDGGNYYFDSTDGSFTINKAASGNPAEMTAGLKIAAGCTLAELGERTVGFAWTNPDMVVGAGEQTFPATYLQNNDATNYSPITVDVPVYGLKRLSVVTVIMGEGGEVTNPGDLAVEEDELTWTISPDEGYELESFVINSEDKTSEVSGGRFTMIAGTDNVTAIARFRKVYEVINGAGQTHIRGVDGAAEFEIDAEYELFEDDGKVYVDGELVNSENYDSRSGSTIITLSEDYLNSLTVGEHTLAVVFADDGIARTTFIIADPEAEEDNPAAADTGVFTGATGGAIATGASVMVIGALVSVMFLAKKNRKE